MFFLQKKRGSFRISFHPGKSTWNLKITNLQRKIIWTKPSLFCSMLIFRGVVHLNRWTFRPFRSIHTIHLCYNLHYTWRFQNQSPQKFGIISKKNIWIVFQPLFFRGEMLVFRGKNVRCTSQNDPHVGFSKYFGSIICHIICKMVQESWSFFTIPGVGLIYLFFLGGALCLDLAYICARVDQLAMLGMVISPLIGNRYHGAL